MGEPDRRKFVLTKQTNEVMKHTFKIWATVLGMAAFTVAGAQNISDPTYSIHNYKHPNKAAQMKAIEDAKPEIYLEQSNKREQADNGLTASANYKGINASKSDIKEFKVSDAPEAKPYFLGNANRNYKQQFPSRSKHTSSPSGRIENGAVASE